jgi:hypothetical protein
MTLKYDIPHFLSDETVEEIVEICKTAGWTQIFYDPLDTSPFKTPPEHDFYYSLDLQSAKLKNTHPVIEHYRSQVLLVKIPAGGVMGPHKDRPMLGRKVVMTYPLTKNYAPTQFMDDPASNTDKAMLFAPSVDTHAIYNNTENDRYTFQVGWETDWDTFMNDKSPTGNGIGRLNDLIK